MYTRLREWIKSTPLTPSPPTSHSCQGTPVIPLCFQNPLRGTCLEQPPFLPRTFPLVNQESLSEPCSRDVWDGYSETREVWGNLNWRHFKGFKRVTLNISPSFIRQTWGFQKQIHSVHFALLGRVPKFILSQENTLFPSSVFLFSLGAPPQTSKP